LNIISFIQRLTSPLTFFSKELWAFTIVSNRNEEKEQEMPKSVAMLGKVALLFASLWIIQLSFSFAQGKSAVTENGPDQELKEFRIDDLEARLPNMEPGPERDYFAGVLANRRGHIPESIQVLNRVLSSIRTSRPDRAAVALQALADDYIKSFQYGDAAQVYDDLLTNFSNHLKPEELKSTKDDAGLARILREAPAQTITWDGAVRLKTERNPLDSVNVALTVNGVQGPWLLDTGANLSVVSKSFAERLGLKFLPGVTQTQAGLTGIENPLRVALLPTLPMGGATLHNVVVMVLDDANLNISLGKQAYQINGIIGYPVFQALGTIAFLHDGEFEAGEEARAAGMGARMYMNHLTPIVECKVEGRDLPFSFDTGASSTDLLVRYYQQFHSASKGWKRSKTMSAGAGGVVKRKIYIQPQVKLGIGDKTVTLERVPIHTSGTGTDIADLYGNLGQDVVANFESFTMDFSTMTLSLGKLLAPDMANPKQ
jgi:predicted aspartyl protease